MSITVLSVLVILIVSIVAIIFFAMHSQLEIKKQEIEFEQQRQLDANNPALPRKLPIGTHWKG